MRVTASIILLGLFAAAPLCAADSAKGFPERPLRIVSPFAAGGNTDNVGRMIAPRLAERLGQNVIIENRPGAGGMVGASHVTKATPDGHTLLFISGAFTAHSAVTRNLPYDPLRDFEWVTTVLTYPFVLVVRADSPVESVRGLIEVAKKKPRALNYGSVGAGSVFHLAAELFNSMAGTEMTHVPYKGSAASMADLIGGRLDLIFSTLTGAFPHIQSQRVKALAVTSPKRSPRFPDVPTLAETLAGYEVMSFAGMGVPRGTPRPIIMRLNRELRAVLDQPEIRKPLNAQGAEVIPGTPEEMTKKVASEIAKWKRIIADRKIDL